MQKGKFKQKPAIQPDLSSLQKTLKVCADKEKEFYNMAMEFLPLIENASKKAIAEVDKAKKRCTEIKFADANTLNNLDSQLKVFKHEFDELGHNVFKQIRNKHNVHTVFNVTLFGQTMVGKSTLMSILTGGNEDAIGKGSQRTTKDVRRYEWNGLNVIDVPGIDAFNGAEDEELALKAARSADLIVFMIQSEEPSMKEAEWLVRLKKDCDKPLLCLINCRCELDDDFALQEFLDAPKEYAMNAERIGAIRDQFNAFIQKLLPGERIPFVAVQLLAELKSRQPQYKTVSKQLHKCSGFSIFEKYLIKEISTNGVLYKCRSYLSNVDSAVYSQYRQLLEQSENSYLCLKSIREKLDVYQKWQRSFMSERYHQIHTTIDNVINRLAAQMPAFVDEKVESKNLNNEWTNYVNGFKINETVHDELERAAHDIERKLNDIFRDLEFEFKQNIEINIANHNIDGSSIFNGKRFWQRASIVTGAVGVTLGLFGVISGPVGWAIAGVSFLFGTLFSWFCDSREDKLVRAKGQLRQKLSNEIDKMRRNAHAVITKTWHEDIIPIENDGYTKLQAVRSLLIALANVERSLAIDYNHAHSKICLRLLNESLSMSNTPEALPTEKVDIARAPGKSWALVNPALPKASVYCEAIDRLGMKERFHLLKYELPKDLKGQVFSVLGYFHVKKRIYIETIEDYDQAIVYIDKKDLSEEERNAIELTGQLLDIHFLQSNL